MAEAVTYLHEDLTDTVPWPHREWVVRIDWDSTETLDGSVCKAYSILKVNQRQLLFSNTSTFNAYRVCVNDYKLWHFCGVNRCEFLVCNIIN